MDKHNTETKKKSEVKKAVKKLEEAFKIYKICEIYANDVSDDYGKQKIAKLRLEFAKHELIQSWDEAAKLGIDLEESEILKNTFK